MPTVFESTFNALVKLNRLPIGKKPTQSIKLQATKEKRYGKTEWLKTPIELVDPPKEILAFKELDKVARGKRLKYAEDKCISTNRLVTKQSVVAKNGVEHFIKHPDCIGKNPIIIFGVGRMNYIWNGNHRCVAALLRGTTIQCKYLRLR